MISFVVVADFQEMEDILLRRTQEFDRADDTVGAVAVRESECGRSMSFRLSCQPRKSVYLQVSQMKL